MGPQIAVAIRRPEIRRRPSDIETAICVRKRRPLSAASNHPSGGPAEWGGRAASDSTDQQQPPARRGTQAVFMGSPDMLNQTPGRFGQIRNSPRLMESKSSRYMEITMQNSQVDQDLDLTHTGADLKPYVAQTGAQIHQARPHQGAPGRLRAPAERSFCAAARHRHQRLLLPPGRRIISFVAN